MALGLDVAVRFPNSGYAITRALVVMIALTASVAAGWVLVRSSWRQSGADRESAYLEGLQKSHRDDADEDALLFDRQASENLCAVGVPSRGEGPHVRTWMLLNARHPPLVKRAPSQPIRLRRGDLARIRAFCEPTPEVLAVLLKALYEGGA